MGIGLTHYITPKQLKQYKLIFSPIVGYSLATLFGWYCYRLDLPGSNVYAPFSLVIPSIINILALINYRTSKCQEPTWSKKGLTLAVLSACIGFLLISIPFIITPNSPTSMAFNNGDIAIYADMSRYLQEFRRSTGVGWITQWGIVQRCCDWLWFGTASITALFSSVLNTEPYKLQSLCINLFFALGIPFAYLFSRKVLKIEKWFSLIITLFYAISPIMYRVVYDGFHGQVTGTSLLLGLITISVICIESDNRKDKLKFLPLLIVFNWALIMSYSFVLIFAYWIAFAYLLLFTLVNKKGIVESMVTASIFLAGILCGFILSPFRFKMLYNQLVLASAPTGFFFGFISPERLVGLLGTDIRLKIGFQYQYLWLWVVIGIILGVGAYYSWRKGNTSISLLIPPLFIVYLAGIVLFLKTPPAPRYSAYKAFKLVGLFSPVFLCIIMGALYFIINKFNTLLKYVILVPVILLLLLGNVQSSFRLMHFLSTKGKFVSADMAGLQKIDSDNRITSINIPTSAHWPAHWEQHFLMRKKLYFTKYNKFAKFTLGQPKGDFNLVTNQSKTDDIIVVDCNQADNDSDHVYINETYKLIKTDSESFECPVIELKDGWYGKGRAHRWTGSAGKMFSLIISCANAMDISFTMDCSPAFPENNLTVFLNENQIEDVLDSNPQPAGIFGRLVIDNLHLKKGENILRFNMSAFPKKLTENSSRVVGYIVSEIKLHHIRDFHSKTK
ncbi:hypothetical protein QUF75_05095 [Desulfococcaceae bacterium HSG7]|nr:hypothetical protein [Desulfococcaceae bacterium HSG7]